jgi:site-specific recombinase XerD
MAVRKRSRSWQYDFTIPGFGRQRQGGFTTRAEATLAEKGAREALLSGGRQLLFSEGHTQYMAATRMKDRGRDAFEHLWKRIAPELGHLHIEDVDTSALDAFKQSLPSHLGPKSINQYLILIRAVLRFLWKRSRLQSVPYVPMESVAKPHVDWYTQAERDELLAGMFRLEPQWYLFYYLTMRLGLRVGEVYAVMHRQIRRNPPSLIVDQAVQRGTKTRPAKLVVRKNDEAYVLQLTEDLLAAVDWHVKAGYSGEAFLFSKTGSFARYIDSHVRPLLLVQQKLGLRALSHHKVGRHSVASQAVTGGESVKAVQAQLGHRSEQSTHKYAHLGSDAQRRLVEALRPRRAPHEGATPPAHGTLASPEVDASRERMP